MSTRSVADNQMFTLKKDICLPQPEHTAIRLIVAMNSFKIDKGPETGYISADLAFKMRRQVPTLQQSQDLNKARSFFFNYVYAHMGTEADQSVDLNDQARLDRGQSLYQSGYQVSNQQRAKAIQFALENLFPGLLEKRATTRSEEDQSTR